MVRVLPFAACFVSQADVDLLVSLENQIRNLKRMRLQKYKELVAQLKAGALVAPGTHSVELRRGRLYVNGHHTAARATIPI